MATNYTQHYHLPKWAKDDSVLMDEFNQAWDDVDAALRANADAVEEVKTSFPIQHFVTGTYTGNDGTKTVSLGFTPKAVYVYCGAPSSNVSYRSALAVEGAAFMTGSKNLLAITNGGFTVTHDTNYSVNYSIYTYRYFAVG